MDKKTDSILASIKKMLGLEDAYTPFDADVITYINSALMTLTQLGIGPKEGIDVTDYSQTWNDFLKEYKTIKPGAVQNYVYLKVRMLFDPPGNSFVMDALKQQAEEIAWRLNVQAESERVQDFITDDAHSRKRGWPGNENVDPDHTDQ